MNFFTHIQVILVGFFSFLYLVNLTGGTFELIPDLFPFLGNMDEIGATVIFLSCLRYYGIDLTNSLASQKKIALSTEVEKHDYQKTS